MSGWLSLHLKTEFNEAAGDCFKDQGGWLGCVHDTRDLLAYVRGNLSAVLDSAHMSF